MKLYYMKRQSVFGMYFCFLTICSAALGQAVQLNVNPDNCLAAVDEKIYGHFLEHIYHSVNGGLWGEMVWNRSFEEYGQNAGIWSVKDGVVSQESLATDVRMWFGEPEWTDYEYTLQARKTGGAEGFLILFRGTDNERFYWYNFGGWGNNHHALEKGMRRRGKSTVGSEFNGQIDENRWYNIKVRCEKNHIQVWLDNTNVIDFTDSDRPHLSGKVGIGTWSTAAEYKNIKVTDPNGNILFEGIPEAVPAAQVARHWKPFGNARFKITKDNPFNSSISQCIESDSGIAGIEQSNFNIVKGEKYHGSVWLKGKALAGVAVMLADGNEVISEAKLPAPSNKWAEYKFQFAPNLTVNNASLKIQLQDKAEICLDQVSLMPQSYEKAGGYRPDLLKAVEDLHPPVIRWPGGCFASPYRWKDAIGPQAKRKVTPRPLWDDLDINSYGTDEFIRMCHQIGSEPLIVVNIGTKEWNGNVDPNEFLQDVLDWIEYCNGSDKTKWGKIRAQNGHPQPYNVKYWEIDNETWGMGDDNYVQAVKKFAPAMRAKDASIKLSACGSGGFNLDWNKKIIDECASLIDYISIHHYENPDLYANGPYNFERFINRTAELIKNSKNPNLKIYCSEWNAQSTDWRTGLYAGGVLNAFERCAPTFEIGGPALFLRHASADSWDNAFINFDSCRWFPAPNYVVMKLWREHYAPNRVEIKADSNSLNVNATLSADKKTLYIKCVNPNNETAPVTLNIAGSFVPTCASMELIAPGSLDARNTLERPDGVRPEDANVTIAGRAVKFPLPPLSVAVVTVKK